MRDSILSTSGTTIEMKQVEIDAHRDLQAVGSKGKNSTWVEWQITHTRNGETWTSMIFDTEAEADQHMDEVAKQIAAAKQLEESWGK